MQNISQRQRKKNILVSLWALYYLLKKYQERNFVKDLPHRMKATKITVEIKAAIKESLQNDSEITSITYITCDVSVILLVPNPAENMH